MDEEAKLLCLQQFQWAVQALAQPASVQHGLFPKRVCVGDELGLDFGHWWEWMVVNDAPVTEHQLDCLTRLDDYLDGMGGERNERLWTDEAVSNSPEWQKVRSLAKEVLDAFGWPNDPPPAGRSVYSVE